jgi:plasmid stability protein
MEGRMADWVRNLPEIGERLLRKADRVRELYDDAVQLADEVRADICSQWTEAEIRGALDAAYRGREARAPLALIARALDGRAWAEFDAGGGRVTGGCKRRIDDSFRAARELLKAFPILQFAIGRDQS